MNNQFNIASPRSYIDHIEYLNLIESLNRKIDIGICKLMNKLYNYKNIPLNNFIDNGFQNLKEQYYWIELYVQSTSEVISPMYLSDEEIINRVNIAKIIEKNSNLMMQSIEQMMAKKENPK
ncbi:hypothetical protein cand_035390 [Cryptosporidium andersoni]|uniref:Uncharacterized protein n=1 Tax=Cryptosporidium andersoni TaxID=117008 RepID=A0A1J4MV97_9CRYT|nr:hypothetical protein cand_035390 [Cryptosporidium andersoni]